MMGIGALGTQLLQWWQGSPSKGPLPSTACMEGFGPQSLSCCSNSPNFYILYSCTPLVWLASLWCHSGCPFAPRWLYLRIAVPFCERLRQVHSGLFTGSFPGPSHQCGDAKHHRFPWPCHCHRKHMAGVCSPLPSKSCFSSCPSLSCSPSMAAWAEPASAPASLHPCYSRVSFFSPFLFFFPLCTHHVRVCEGCILENKFIH